MKKLLRSVGAPSKKALAVFVGSFATSSAFAIESEQITAAFEAGEGVMTTVVTGLIAMAAIAVGVGLVLSLMKKS